MTDELTICARAIIDVLYGGKCDGMYDRVSEDLQHQMRNIARACLTALSENISEKMVEAGSRRLKEFILCDFPVSAAQASENMFLAMLATALRNEANDPDLDCADRRPFIYAADAIERGEHLNTQGERQ